MTRFATSPQRSIRLMLAAGLCWCGAFGSLLADDGPAAPDYSREVAPIFQKYCNGCHNAKEAEGGLVLESFPQLMKGGDNGAVVAAGDVEKSKLIRLVEGKDEPAMPPEGNKGPSEKEISLLKAWIVAGAKGPAGKPSEPRGLTTPKIEPKGAVREPVTALAWSSDGKWIAVGRYQRVEILSAADSKVARVLEGPTGNVNDVGFSADGAFLFAAAGEPGLAGEAVLWSTTDWSRVQTFRGHADCLYAANLSPDGKLLATAGYDQIILVWDAATGKEVRQITGHNGPVFDLAFHPEGRILASASGDRTVKLWDVATGERLDTLNQPAKEQYAVAFSPDGRRIVAGGVDNRIRIWEIREQGREGTNPIIEAKFAHEAPILKLAYTPDGRSIVSSAEDRTVKIWDAREFAQTNAFAAQSDWTPALAVAPSGDALAVGRLDGTLGMYRLEAGQADASDRPVPVLSSPVPDVVKESAADKLSETAETEPNDAVEQATPVSAPGVATGVLAAARDGVPDADLYRFEAKGGESWIVETSASRQKSPADTRIDILDAAGKPVLRYRLRAVRDSYITFRPIDSRQGEVRVENWEEMELNQYLYMEGEVCKIFRMPRGPDSGFAFYVLNGARRCYFDTSGTTHAKDSPIYVVEPYPAGTDLPDNGLPVFPLYYANDDDGDRKLGNDSRVTFTAPADGAYLVRVTDVRGLGGPDFAYSLTIRRPRPDFQVSIGGRDAKVPAGSGQRFACRVDRIDGFDGDVKVEITGVPAGYRATSPIVIQQGHSEAQGVLNAAPDAKSLPAEEWAKVKITASSDIHGETIVKDVEHLGAVELQPKPKVIVTLTADDGAQAKPAEGEPVELVIAPGTTITAMLRVERNGFDGDLRFDVDNLPHGVIVDNIGLSGILVRAGESERQIFLTAAGWVPETTRWIHAVTTGEGNQASLPILLTVRRRGGAPGQQTAENKADTASSAGK